MQNIDQNKILAAIEGAKVSAAAREEGAGLLDFWIQETAELDGRDETLAVEAGFYVQHGETFIVGTQDRIARSHVSRETFGCEWKSTKNETKFWNARTWYDSISKGHQVATYALGLKTGVLVEPVSGDFAFSEDGSVNILVRAVSKSSPPKLWPSAEGQFVNVSEERMQATLNTYLNVAQSIRALRGSGVGPWALPGIQCTNMFRKQCPFYESCTKFQTSKTNTDIKTLLQSFSPGSQVVVQHLVDKGLITRDNVGEVVVLSASTLGSYAQCPERWRREATRSVDEASGALDVGTVLHTGLAEVYSQMKEEK